MQCGFCGFDFSEEMYARLSVYFELRKEIEELRRLQGNLGRGLDRVSERVGQYEAIIDKEMGLRSAETTKEIPIPVQKPAILPETATAKGHPDMPRPAVKKSSEKAEADRSQFEVRFGQKWLLIIGIVTMVFGIGYFLKYSFEQGWVGPAGRVAMAYFWGIALMVGGNWFRRKFETYGLYLIGGGVATLYFSTFAAFQIYHLLSQPLSFFVMVLITVLASMLSIIYDAKWLAVLGIIGGFLTPVLLSTGQDNQIVLMTYMTILNCGLLGIAMYKKWDLLNGLGFVFTYILYSAWFGSHYAESKFWPSIIFLNVFYLLYTVMPFAYGFFRLKSEKISGFLIITPNSFIAFGYSYFMIEGFFSQEWVSVVSVIYAVVFLLMASYLYKKERYREEVFAVLLAKAALFLVITVPLIFSRHWITIFWAAQALTLLWTGVKLGRKNLMLGAYILLALATVKFLYYDYPLVFHFNPDSVNMRETYTYLLAERLITSALLLLVFCLFAFVVKKESLPILPVSGDAPLFLTFFGILLFIVLNIETASFFYDYLPAARFAALSVLWTVFSVVLMVLGFKYNNPPVRRVSLGLFAVTLLKVFLFDMSNISTPYRIISFILLGVVLVGTSYLYHKFKDRIIDVMSGDHA
jgi:uncharacterized membrane protein